ncbi:MAG: hypothetical protein JXO44_14280 [Clostridia bacterium]|nr:hypothetical protein [Clostridia bacterium]
MKLNFYEWIKDKAKRGEEIKFTALLIDTDNSPLLKNSAKRMVEEGIALEIEDGIDLDNEDNRTKIDRMFIYHVNKYALDHLVAESEEMARKATRSKAMMLEFTKLPNTTDEQIAEVKKEIEQQKEEAIQNIKRVNFIKAQFEDQENIDGFINDGTVWFRDDKQVALDIIDEIKEVKDDKVNNFITASALIHEIDALINRINHTIEQLDLFINGESNEINIEVEGIEEMTQKDKIALSAEEAQKEKIEPTHLENIEKKEELAKAQEAKQAEDEVLLDGISINIDDVEDNSPAPSPFPH